MQHNKNCQNCESGVSEIIGVVLLIALVVTAIAVISIGMFSQPPPQKIPALDAIISTSGNSIQITHNGGDQMQKEDVVILVDGVDKTSSFSKGGDSSWQSLSPGDSLTSNSPNPGTVTILYKGGSANAMLSSAKFGDVGNVTADFRITASSGSGGTISPTGTVPAIYGESYTFTMTPNSGYHIVDVLVDGSSVGAVSSYTIGPVMKDYTISATFAIQTYTITPSAGAGGAISPNTPQNVIFGGSQGFTITPDLHYHITNVLVDGGSVGTNSSYTFTNVAADHTIDAAFAIDTYTINATAGANGAIVPSGAVSVNYGASQIFNINPNAGYHIAGVLVDGGSVGTNSSYTFSNVAANHTISASFAINAPTVTSIIPSTGVNTSTISITNLAGTDFLSGATVKLNRTGYADIAGTSVTVVSPTQITCTFDLTGKTAGQWNVAIINPDGQSGMLSNGFTISAPAPTVTSIIPSTGVNTSTISITNLAGTGFLSGATVKLNRTGYADITGTSVNVVSPTQITCTFDLTGKTAGQWNVVVTNYDGQSGMLSNGFTITAPAPTVTSITPSTGLNSTTIGITNLAGTYFLSGATVKLNRTGYADIAGTSVNVVSPTQITCTFDLTGKETGQWNVAVTNYDGKSGMLSNGFTISAPAPTVTSITPSTGLNSTTIGITNLAGTGFLSGATVKLNRTGYADIAGTSVNVVSPTQITCTFDLTGKEAGQWNVAVTNYDGKSGMLSNGFTISAPAPTVTSITPSTGLNTSTISITNLAGTGFLSGATVKLNRTGYADIAGTSVTVVSPTQITCTFDLTGKTAGQWNVAVTNYDGKSGMLSNGFTITAPAPTVTSITPSTGLNSTTIGITNLAGTYFLSGATVKLNRTGYADIAGTSVNVVSPTQITCTFDLTGKEAGQWNVAVTNYDGKSGMLSNGFTISAPAPTVTSITPSTGLNTSTISITNLAGTGFLSGATVKLNRTGYADIAGTSVTVVSPTNITCTFDLTGKIAGQWNVAVTNYDGKSGMLSNGFTISAPAPTVTSITPSTGLNSTTIGITNLAGTYFLSGATVKLNRTGYADIAGTSVTVVSPTNITCTFDLTGKEAGQWNVAVTNYDGKSGMLSSGFAISAPAPTVTSITPSTGLNSTTIGITNLAGTYFLSGATVKLNRTGYADIAGTGVTVVSPTQITCTFDLTGKETGPWNVAVTNYDGKSGMLANGFTISAPAPTISSITPANGVNTTSIGITNLAGTYFLSGATVKLNRTGYADIPGTSVTVVSPTQITCTFDLTDETYGQWNVAVINPDGKSGMLSNGFTITAPAPTVTSITPSTGLNSTTIGITNLAGTYFLSGATVKLNRTGYADITGTSVTVVSPTQITCTFDLTNKKTGLWNIAVINPDGQSGMLSNGFTITAPRTQIYYNGFESDNAGWTLVGAARNNGGAIPKNQNWSMRFRSTSASSIVRPISTAGYQDIIVQFAWALTSNNAANDAYAAYSTNGGTTYQGLTQIDGPVTQTSLSIYTSPTLPAAANNNANFRLRVNLTGNENVDLLYVDDVKVTGIPI